VAKKGKKREKRVLIAKKRDILNRVVIEVRFDLVNHPYFLIINIWELYLQTKAKIGRIRLIISYNNKIGLETVYQGDINFNRRAINDID
jgi:glutamine synthetase type III